MKSNEAQSSVPCRSGVRLCGLLTVALALTALIGWCLDVPVLASWGEGNIPMAPSTAVLLLLQGLAVWLRSRGLATGESVETEMSGSRRTYWTCAVLHAAGIPVALTLLTLSSQGVYLEFERLRISPSMSLGNVPVGHMSPLTALCLLLAGISFLLSMPSERLRPWRIAVAACLAAFLIVASAVLLLAYLYGSPLLYTGSVIPPALATSVAVLALALAAAAFAVPKTWRFEMRRTTSWRETATLVLVFAFFAASVVTVGYLEALRLEKRYRIDVERRLAAVADQRADEIAQWRRNCLGGATICFKNEPFTELVRRFLAEPDAPEPREALRTWLSRIQSAYDYDRVVLLDASGTERAWAPEGGQRISLTFADQISESMKSGKIAIQDFYRQDESGNIYLAVLVPILDPKDHWRPIGTMVIRIDPNRYLYPLIRRWPTPSETAETFLVRKAEDEAVYLNDLRFREDAALALRDPLVKSQEVAVKAAQGEEGIVEGIDYRGEPVVAALRAVPDVPWRIVAKMDVAEVYAPVRERLWVTAVFVGLMLLSAGIGLGLVWRLQRMRFYRKEYESAEALRKSEALNRSLIEHLPQRIMVKDRDSRYVMCNAVYARDLGISPEEIVGKDDYAFFPRDLADTYRAGDQAVMESKVSRVIEEKYLVDNTECWIHTVKIPFTDDRGQAIGVVVIFEDITSRKRAEQALRESERFAQATLNGLSSSVAIMDGDGRILAVNDAWRRFACENGAAVQTVCEGTDYLAVCDAATGVDSEIAREVAKSIRDILAGRREVFSIEYPCHSPCEQRWFVCMLSRFPGEGPSRVVIAHENVTERKLAELTTRELQERLQRAVRAGNVGLWDWDLASNKVYYSTEWKRQIGHDEEEISDNFQEWQDRIHPDDLDRMLEAIQTYLANQRSEYVHEFRMRHKDGSYRWILAQASLLRDATGEPIRMMGSHVDVTERKTLEEQFLQAQKMESVGRLAGGVAHDFNNLLSVINGYADFLLKKAPPGSEMHGDLELIRSAGERATALTRQLLAFSRKQVLQPEVLDLGMLMTNVKKLLARLIGEDVELVFLADRNPVRVKVDPGQMEQVIINLAVNARDAMPNGGKLTIEIKSVVVDVASAVQHIDIPPGEYALLSVSDNGVGMSKETMQHIFDPFFTTKGVGKGTGLGLATVYGIVRQSGGQTIVYSEQGVGTTFKIYLPLVQEDQKGLSYGATRKAAPKAGLESILVVEDDAAVRRIAQRILKEAGYSVLAVANGKEAIEALNQNTNAIDLMLTDLVMPGVNGRELAEWAMVARPGLQIVYMSGYTDDAILHHGVLEDTMHFISKPFTAADLTGKIRLALDHRIDEPPNAT